MNKDKRNVILISLALFAVLLAAFIFGSGNSRIVTSIILVTFAMLTCLIIKKRTSLSVNKREVLLLMTVLAVIYVAAKELSGVYFEFYKNPYFVNPKRFLTVIIPSVIIVVASEVIRQVLLAQKIRLTGFFTYLSCVIADALVYSNMEGIISFNRFMDLVGLTLFPAISANIFYHFISKRYGMWPNIVFRLITTLYIYFVPATTGMSDALDSCIRIIIPIVLMAFVSSMYEKKKRVAAKKKSKFGWVGTVLIAVILISIAMLISCQFRFGALVIATESMTGEINKGDVIIYERYDGGTIRPGQVIVFSDNDSRVVHRVTRIENINGEVRYYTKGDANPTEDAGYRTVSDIVGLTDLKIVYIGYPSLWLRELIAK